MKRGTTPTLRVQIDVDPDIVERVDFLFKQFSSEDAPALLEKRWPSDDVSYSDGKFLIAISAEETRRFQEQRSLYMDTRISMIGGKIPATEIVTLMMHPTLFSEDDDD